jgi:hypothetical protein
MILSGTTRFLARISRFGSSPVPTIIQTGLVGAVCLIASLRATPASQEGLHMSNSAARRHRVLRVAKDVHGPVPQQSPNLIQDDLRWFR